MKYLREHYKIYASIDSVRQFFFFCEHPNKAFLGSIPPEELNILSALVNSANAIAGPIIEVGTLFGFTTQIIAANKSIDKELITIDNYSWNPIGINQNLHRELTKRVLYYLTDKCLTCIVDCSSSEFYSSYKGDKPSMVFIDAGHGYNEVIMDVKWAADNKIPIIAGHDYCDLWPGVRKAVDEVFGEKKHIVGSIWVYVQPEYRSCITISHSKKL